MTFTSAVFRRTGKGGRAIALIGGLVCAGGIGVGVALDPLTTLASVAGVIGLLGLMTISKRQPAWILITVLFGIQVGSVWLPAWNGRRLPLSLADFGVILLVVSALARFLAHRWSPHRSPLDVWWALFLFTLLPSLWFTRDLLWWMAGFRDIVQGMIVFYLVYEMIETLPQARKLGLLLAAWGSIAAITLINNVFASSKGYLFVLLSKKSDVTWAVSDYFGSFMLIIIPVAVFMAIYEKGKIVRWSLNLGAVAMASAMLLTRSTGALLVGIISVMLWILVQRGGRMMKLLGWLVLIGAVIVVGSLLFSDVARNTVGDLPMILSNFWQTEKAEGRLMIWRYNLDLFWQSPWIGNGLLNTLLWQPKNRFGAPATFLAPHNYIIQVLAQTGMVGMVGFVMLWWHTGLGVLKNWRAAPEGTWRKGLLAGIMMGVIAAMLNGVIEPNILERDCGMILWATIGLGYAVGRIQGRETTQNGAAKG